MEHSWILSLCFAVLLILNVFAAQSLARHLDEPKVDSAALNKPGRNIYPKPPIHTAPHEASKVHHADSKKGYPEHSKKGHHAHSKKSHHADSTKVHPAAHEMVSGASEAKNEASQRNEVTENGSGEGEKGGDHEGGGGAGGGERQDGGRGCYYCDGRGGRRGGGGGSGGGGGGRGGGGGGK